MTIRENELNQWSGLMSGFGGLPVLARLGAQHSPVLLPTIAPLLCALNKNPALSFSIAAVVREGLHTTSHTPF